MTSASPSSLGAKSTCVVGKARRQPHSVTTRVISMSASCWTVFFFFLWGGWLVGWVWVYVVCGEGRGKEARRYEVYRYVHRLTKKDLR